MFGQLPQLLYFMEIVAIGSVGLICLAIVIGALLKMNLLSQGRPSNRLIRSI
jgi:hypothetical protein